MNIIKYVKLKDKTTLEMCPECNNTHFIFDYRREEVICASCSLILKNNEFISINQIENEVVKNLLLNDNKKIIKS